MAPELSSSCPCSLALPCKQPCSEWTPGCGQHRGDGPRPFPERQQLAPGNPIVRAPLAWISARSTVSDRSHGTSQTACTLALKVDGPRQVLTASLAPAPRSYNYPRLRSVNSQPPGFCVLCRYCAIRRSRLRQVFPSATGYR